MANVKVAVRVRPLSKREIDSKAKVIIEVNGGTTSVINLKIPEGSEWDNRERLRHFQFDYSYSSITPDSPSASQELVFRDLGVEVIEAILDGYNACVFAYGQSGSGKSYTMMGCPDELGLTPRLCEHLFTRLDNAAEEKVTFKADVSFLEIYNERVRDLLRTPSSRRKKLSLKIREHPKRGTYVQDLTRHKVSNFDSVLALIEKGNKNRSVASTETHDHSSRSHAIFTINFTQAHLDAELPSEIVSKINLVDLAGSERASLEFNRNRLKEGGNINKSLVTLGNVISALADKSLSSSWSLDSLGSSFSINSSAGESVATTPASSPRRLRQPFVPYRDSVLTWLLKDSLGGNSKTIMIATISPASTSYSETINTLRYAQRAKCIINRPVINEEPNVKLIRQLRAEITRLRALLAAAQINNIIPSSFDEVSINEILNQNENKALALTRSWIEKWHGSEAIVAEHEMRIRKSNAGVVVDSPLPHLVALDNHILSTGIHIYYLKQGTTSLGRNELPSIMDEVESDTDALQEHCQLHFDGINVTLSPMTADACQINGQLVCQPTHLKQADIVKIGKHHTLRFNNPAEVLQLKEKNKLNETNWDSGIQSESFVWNGTETSPNQNWSNSVNDEMESGPNSLCGSCPHVNGLQLAVNDTTSDTQFVCKQQVIPDVELSEEVVAEELELEVKSLSTSVCSKCSDIDQDSCSQCISSFLNVQNERDHSLVDNLCHNGCEDCAVESSMDKSLPNGDLNCDHVVMYANGASTNSNQLLCNNNDFLCNSKCQTHALGDYAEHEENKLLSSLQARRHSRDDVTSRDVENFLQSSTLQAEKQALECLSSKAGAKYQGSDERKCKLQQLKAEENMNWADHGLCFESVVADQPRKMNCNSNTEDGEVCAINSSLCCEQDSEILPSAVLVYSVMENGLSCALTDSSDSGITCTHNQKNSLRFSREKTAEKRPGCIGSDENSLTESPKTGPLLSLGSQMSEELSEETCFSSSELAATDNDCALEHVHTSTPSSSVVDSFQTSCGLCRANSWETMPGIDLCNNNEYNNSCFCEKATASGNVEFKSNKSSSLLNNTYTRLRNRKPSSLTRRPHQRNSNSHAYKHNRGRHRRPVKVKRVVSVKKGVRLTRADEQPYSSVKLKKTFPNDDLTFTTSASVSYVPETNTESNDTCILSDCQSVTQHNQIGTASVMEDTSLSNPQSCQELESSHHRASGGLFNPTLLSEAKNFVTFAKDITDSQQLMEVLHKQLLIEKKEKHSFEEDDMPANSNKEHALQPATKACNLSPEIRLLIAQSATDIHKEVLAKEEAASALIPMENESNSCASGELLVKREQCVKSLTSEVNVIQCPDSLHPVVVSCDMINIMPSACVENFYISAVEKQEELKNENNVFESEDQVNACNDLTPDVEHKVQRTECNAGQEAESLRNTAIKICKRAENNKSVRRPPAIPIVQLSISECPPENESDFELKTSPLSNTNFLSVTPPFSPVELKRSLSNTDIQQSLQTEMPSGEVDAKFCPAVSSPFKMRTNSWPEPSQLSLDQLDSEIRDLQEGLKEELVNEVMVQIGQDGIDMTVVPQCLKDVLEGYPGDVAPYETLETKRNAYLELSDATEQFSDSLDETDDNRRLKRSQISYQSLSPGVANPKCPTSEILPNPQIHATFPVSSFGVTPHGCTLKEMLSNSELFLSKSSDSDHQTSTVLEKNVSPKYSKRLIRQRARLCLCQENSLGGPSEDGCYSDDSLVEKCQRHSKKFKASKLNNAITASADSNETLPNAANTSRFQGHAASPTKQELRTKQNDKQSFPTKLSPKGNKLSPTSKRHMAIKRSPRSRRRLERLTKVTCSADLDDDLRTANEAEETEFILTVVNGHASMTSSCESFAFQENKTVGGEVINESQGGYSDFTYCDDLVERSEGQLGDDERHRLENEMPQIFITRPSITTELISPEETSEIEEIIEGITDEESAASYIDEFESYNSEEDDEDSEDDDDDETDEDEEIEERYYIPINASMHVQPETSDHGPDEIGHLRTMAEVGLSPVNLCPDGNSPSVDKRKASQCNLFTAVGRATTNSSGQSISSVGENNLLSTKTESESFLADDSLRALKPGKENSTAVHPDRTNRIESVKYGGLHGYEGEDDCFQNMIVEDIKVQGNVLSSLFATQLPVTKINTALAITPNVEERNTFGNLTDDLVVETNSWEAFDIISPCGSDSYTLSSDTSHEDVFADSSDVHMSPVDILIDYRILSPSERRRLYTIPEMSSEYSSTPSDGVIGSIEFEAVSALEDGASVIEFCDNEITTLHRGNIISEVNDTGQEVGSVISRDHPISATSFVSTVCNSSPTALQTDTNSSVGFNDGDISVAAAANNAFLLQSIEPVPKIETLACTPAIASSCSAHNNELLKYSDKLPSQVGENEKSLRLQYESQSTVGAANNVALDNSCDLGIPLQHDSCPAESPGQAITQLAVTDQAQFLASDHNSQPESGECRELWKLYKRFSEESDEEDNEEKLEAAQVASAAAVECEELNPSVHETPAAGEPLLCDELESEVKPSLIDYSHDSSYKQREINSFQHTQEGKMVMQCKHPSVTEVEKVSSLHQCHKSNDLGNTSDDGLKLTVCATAMELAHSEACKADHNELPAEMVKEFAPLYALPTTTADTTSVFQCDLRVLYRDDQTHPSNETENYSQDMAFSAQLQQRSGEIEHQPEFSKNYAVAKEVKRQDVGCSSCSNELQELNRNSPSNSEICEDRKGSNTSSATEIATKDLCLATPTTEKVSDTSVANLFFDDNTCSGLTDSSEIKVPVDDSGVDVNYSNTTAMTHHKDNVLLHQSTSCNQSSQFLTSTVCEKLCTDIALESSTEQSIVASCIGSDCLQAASIKEDKLCELETRIPLPKNESNDVVFVSDIDIYIDSLFSDALSCDNVKLTPTDETKTVGDESVTTESVSTPPEQEKVTHEVGLFISTWPVNSSDDDTRSQLPACEYSSDNAYQCSRSTSATHADDSQNNTLKNDTNCSTAVDSIEPGSSDVMSPLTHLVSVSSNRYKLLPAIEISAVKSPTRIHDFSPDVAVRSQFVYPSSEESERGRESSITPDSLESLCRDTTSMLVPAISGTSHHSLTSWRSHHTAGNHFTIRSKPVTKAPPYRATRHRNLDLGTFNDLWGASSDSITFVFVGPGPCTGMENQGYDRQRPNSSLSDSDTLPYSTIGLYPYFKTPCSILPRSVSLDCIHLQRHYGMAQLTARAASMESMVPEDLMGVVERGRLHEIDLEELNGKSVRSTKSPSLSDRGSVQIPWSHNLVAKYPTKHVWCCGKAFSQGSVADESSVDNMSHSFRKCKKSVSWSDLSGYELINGADGPIIKQRKPRFLKPIIKKLETPLVEHPPDNAFGNCNPPATDDPLTDDNHTEYTDNDVDKDLMNSALYKRIQKRANPQAWMQSRPQPTSFSLKLPDHVKARIGRTASESTSTESSADSQTEEAMVTKDSVEAAAESVVCAVDECVNEDEVEGHGKLVVSEETVNTRSTAVNQAAQMPIDKGLYNSKPDYPCDPPVLSQVLTNFVSKKEVFQGAHMSDIVAQLQPNSCPSGPADWAGLSSVMMEASNFFRELSKFCVSKTPANTPDFQDNTIPKTEVKLNPTLEIKEKCDTATQTESSGFHMMNTETVTNGKSKFSSVSTQTSVAVETEEQFDRWRCHDFIDAVNAHKEHIPAYSEDNDVNLPYQRKLDQNSRASSFQSEKFIPILLNSTAKHNNNAVPPGLSTVKTSPSVGDMSRHHEYRFLSAIDSAEPSKSLHLQSRAREVNRNRREACLKKELEILNQEKARVLHLLQQFCSTNAWHDNAIKLNGNSDDCSLPNGYHSEEDVEACGGWESVQYLVTYQARLQDACSRVTSKLEKLARQSRVEDYVFHQVSQTSSDGSCPSPPSSDYLPLNRNSQVSLTQHPFCSKFASFSSHNLSSYVNNRPVIGQVASSDLPASPSWANLSQSSSSSAAQQRTGSITSSLSLRSRTVGERVRPREYQAHLLDIRRSLVSASRSSSSSARSPLSRTPPSPPQRLLPSDSTAQSAPFIVNDKLPRNLQSSDSRASSHDSSLECADSNHPFNSSKSFSSDSSAEDIQKLLEECRAARVRAQIEIELAQQQLKSQRLAVKSLETMFKQRT